MRHDSQNGRPIDNGCPCVDCRLELAYTARIKKLEEELAAATKAKADAEKRASTAATILATAGIVLP